MSDNARETRNAMFANALGNPQALDPNQRSVSMVDAVKAEFGLDVPLERVPLASKGLIYPEGHPLHNAEFIEITPMTTREEDILTSPAYIKKGTIITELIKSCIVDKRIDPTTLISGDRNTLMVAIRVSGYGAEYDCEIDCSECDIKGIKQSFDLSQLCVKCLEIAPVQPFENVFSYTLPKTKKVVKFKFLTGQDEEEILAVGAKMKKHGMNTENNVTTGLIYSVLSIDSVTDKNKISQFIRMMPARDSLALRTYIRDNDPGIVMRQEITCPHCGATKEVDIPVGPSFFWPHVK